MPHCLYHSKMTRGRIATTALTTRTLSRGPVAVDGLLRAAKSRDRFVAILEEVRQRYRFVVIGYVTRACASVDERTRGGETVGSNAGIETEDGARALLPKRKPRDLRQGRLFWGRRGGRLLGRRDFTTSTFGPRKSGWRNWDICIRIP